MNTDPYIIGDSTVKEPPTSFVHKLKFLGPGFILSASIVGSGELIATTTLGAKAGFAAFWIIILSCLAKVAVQLEFGKHTILSGETAIQAFAKLPGPKIGKGKWAVWMVLVALILKLVQVGGILGGTAIILNMLFPSFSILSWTLITAMVAASLIFKGYYSTIEKLSLLMITLFTVLTLASLYFLKYTPYSFSWNNIIHNAQFNLSGEVTAVAIGAFGITGVASDEIIAYTYWCIEKGYAAYVGPRNETPEWKARAQGWINVMYLDAIVAMTLYTSVTAAFYLLGAAVLHHRGEVPDENHLVETLSLIFTQSLGQGSRIAFLVGGFFVLFSSVFATLAAWTRVFPDIFGQLGWTDFGNILERKKIIAVVSWVLPFAWATTFLFMKVPLVMVLSGGMVGSVLLFMVVFAGLHFRYKRMQLSRPGLFYDTALWISIISILGVGIYGVVKIFAHLEFLI